MTDLQRLTSPVGLTLGEGPVWNQERQELSVVDIFGRKILRIQPTRDGWSVVGEIATPSDVGGALPLDSGEFLTLERDGLFLVTEDSRKKASDLPVADPSFRCNDGKLGPDGRVWVGVMDYDATPKAASLWAIPRSGEAVRLLDGLTIPNGMDWWEDEFWFVDGPTPVITCYRVAGDTLTPTGATIALTGTPDGMCIDSAGDIWVALWGEGRVECHSRTGEKKAEISVPAAHSTSVAFCGPELTTLAITSARFALDDLALGAQPESGEVFFVEPGASGRLPSTRWV